MKSWKDDSTRVVGTSMFLAVLAGLALMLASLGLAEAAPPDCSRIAKSIRERDCCTGDARNCSSLWAAFAKRACEAEPCEIGCGMNVCNARADEYCCNESCSTCAPVGAVCPAEICP